MGWFHQSFSNAQISVQKSGKIEVTDDFKKALSSMDNETNIQVSPQRLWHHTQNVHKFNTDIVPVLRGKVDNQSQPSPRNSLQMIYTG